VSPVQYGSRVWATVCKTVRPMLSGHSLSCLSWLSVCNVGVLLPNGWTNQDETWHGGRPRPGPHCVRWVAAASKKWGTAPPILSRILWPNGCMDQDATWYGSKTRPSPGYIMLYVDPAPPKKGHSTPPLFGPCLLWLKGRQSQLLLSSCLTTSDLSSIKQLSSVMSRCSAR